MPLRSLRSLDLDPTTGSHLKFTTGLKKPVDMEVTQLRKAKDRTFSPMIRSLAILPTRENWQRNPRDEAFLDDIRYQYEAELMVYFDELKRMPLPLCILAWQTMRNEAMLGENEDTGSDTIRTYVRYIKEFPLENDDNEEERDVWWDEQDGTRREPSCSRRSRDTRQRSPLRITTYGSPERYQQMKNRKYVGDVWTQESCTQKTPQDPVLCVLRFSPERSGAPFRNEPGKTTGKKHAKRAGNGSHAKQG